MSIAEIRADVRRMGWAGWIMYALDRVLARCFGGRAGLHALRFYLQPVPDLPVPSNRPGDSIRIGRIERGAIDPAAFGRPLEAISDRYDDGSVCIAALKGEELVGFLWLQSGSLRERIVRCRLHANPAEWVEWDYDVFIDPRYRLGRLFGRLWQAAAEDLRRRNRRGTVSWVKWGNWASAHAHARLGARSIGWAVFLVLFGHQFMVGSLRPRFAYTPPGASLDLHVDTVEEMFDGTCRADLAVPLK